MWLANTYNTYFACELSFLLFDHYYVSENVPYKMFVVYNVLPM